MLKANLRTFPIALCAGLAIAVALGAGGSAQAEGRRWTLQLEPMYMEVYGHDQHVLTIHQVDLGSTPQMDAKTAVTLDTDSGPAYRAEFQRAWGQWGLGVDFFWFTTSQGTADLTASGGGPLSPARFEIADQSYTSTGPSEVLFYRVLEDTDLAVWTVDLYGLRTLAEKPESAIELQFGLRFGDFDNDYRAVVGIQDVAGTRVDASSNYDLMMGLVLGLTGEAHRGNQRIKGYIGQSVLFGSVELISLSRDFSGSFSETPAFVDEEILRAQRDVAIPITELRLKWTYHLGDHVAVGLGAASSAWWDVAVPPGVIPIADGDEALHENTIVFFGLLAAVEVTF